MKDYFGIAARANFGKINTFFEELQKMVLRKLLKKLICDLVTETGVEIIHVLVLNNAKNIGTRRVISSGNLEELDSIWQPQIFDLYITLLIQNVYHTSFFIS